MNLIRFVLYTAATALLFTSSPAQRVSVRSGPMVGFGEIAETVLWLQTSGPATVQYRYWIEGDRKGALLSIKVKASDESDFITKVPLTNLAPGTRYEYELLLDGKRVALSRRLTFVTQSFWQWRKDPAEFTVAFGSCAFINDPPSDRPGPPYAGDYHIFNSIAQKNPDLMLWLGDNWYYREDDYFAPLRMRQRVARDRALPELQALLGSTHHYAVWDDHDFGPNNSDRTYSLRSEALNIFKDYWANPVYGTAETPGVFFRFGWEDAEFFMLDNRYHRSPNTMPKDANKAVLGAAQLQWLRESLVSSEARFKIIVVGAQILHQRYIESMYQSPHEYNQLIGWIKEQKISGVLILAGDRHLAELSVLRDPAFYPLYEFTSSPLTAGVSSRGKADENTLLVPGTFVNDARNFGILRFAGAKETRRLIMELYDANGALRWSHTVKANDLLPAK